MTKQDKRQRILEVIRSCKNMDQKTVAINWGLDVMSREDLREGEYKRLSMLFKSWGKTFYNGKPA